MTSTHTHTLGTWLTVNQSPIDGIKGTENLKSVASMRKDGNFIVTKVIAELVEHRDADHIVRCVNAHVGLLTALQALTEWGCTHTSPLDANSPHTLLIAARAAIAKATS